MGYHAPCQRGQCFCEVDQSTQACKGKRTRIQNLKGTCHQCPCSGGKASVGIIRTGCVNMNIRNAMPLPKGLWLAVNEDLGATSSIPRMLVV
jgi:hypothetical protein